MSRPMDSAAQLLERWQREGDRDALDSLLRVEVLSLKEQLRTRGRTMLGTSASPSDVAQDAVLRLLSLEEPPKFDDPKAFRGYLWTSAWRLLLKRIRKPNLQVFRVDTTSSQGANAFVAQVTSGAGSGGKDDGVAAVGLALNLMTDDERQVLKLVYFDDLKLEGAAQQLGVSKEAVNMRLVRARRKLAKKLSEWMKLVG
jgi:RNA polymerase sigma factor (sigma-70 family)